MDIPHERYYLLCVHCVRRIFLIRTGPRRWTSRPFFEIDSQDFILGRRNYTAGGLPSVFAFDADLPGNPWGAVVPRGRFVHATLPLATQPPPPPPPPRISDRDLLLEVFGRPYGPQPRHLAEAPWHAHGARGDGDSSGDGEMGEHQQDDDGESSDNPWADIQ